MATFGLEENKRVAYYEYDFAKEGGAIGTVILRGPTLPQNAHVHNGLIMTSTAVTSGGAATIALGLETTTDIKAATAITNFTANSIQATVPVGTAASTVRVSSASGKCLTATIGTAALTAGKFTVALEYVLR